MLYHCSPLGSVGLNHGYFSPHYFHCFNVIAGNWPLCSIMAWLSLWSEGAARYRLSLQALLCMWKPALVGYFFFLAGWKSPENTMEQTPQEEEWAHLSSTTRPRHLWDINKAWLIKSTATASGSIWFICNIHHTAWSLALIWPVMMGFWTVNIWVHL